MNSINLAKSCTSANLQNYSMQRSKCAKVLRNAKQQYFNNLNSKSIADTKKFCKTVSKTANWTSIKYARLDRSYI